MNHLDSRSSYEINTRPMSGASSIVVYLSHRQISWLAIAAVCLIGAFFLGGYCMGVHRLSYGAYDQQARVPDAGKNKQSGCYAQLASFGSQYAATLFVEHLQQKKIIAKVVQRKNETIGGKSIIWYQVVTEIFDTQDELRDLLRKLEQEKLNDIRIIVC